MTAPKTLVAMSGGVDSSVTAALLKDEGHEITGLFMRNGITADPSAKPNKQGCCSLGDSQDARFIAHQLDAKFFVLNFADDFQRVIDYFVDEYRRGRTPNPCAVCNTDLKFGKLLDYANMIGADKVATGHYARVVQRDGRWRLLRGRDRGKDQSYYLFGLTQEQLSRACFPLGDLEKTETRELAEKYELRTAQKPDSQEICFVPYGDYRAVIREHDPSVMRAGKVVNTQGEVLGKHEGVANFTVGQRRGLGIASERPYYVVRLEPETATVVVGDKDDLLVDSVHVAEVNWIAIEDLAEGESLRAVVKVRYRHDGDPATITRDGPTVKVTFDTPLEGASPGQCAVFYAHPDNDQFDADETLGGGWIL